MIGLSSVIPSDLIKDLEQTKAGMQELVKTLHQVKKLMETQNALLQMIVTAHEDQSNS